MQWLSFRCSRPWPWPGLVLVLGPGGNAESLRADRCVRLGPKLLLPLSPFSPLLPLTCQLIPLLRRRTNAYRHNFVTLWVVNEWCDVALFFSLTNSVVVFSMAIAKRITRTASIICTLTLVLLLFARFNDAPSKRITEEFFMTHPITSFSTEPTTLYLTYLPHSGFHNQRISLENAFVLAALLNRTLIVPPARLGSNSIPYLPTRKLVSAIESSNDPALKPCPSREDFDSILGTHLCNPYGDFVHLSWRHLMPLDRLRNRISFVERDDMRQTWFKTSLGIHPDDIYWVRDKSPYEFHFYDKYSGVSTSSKKYGRHIHLGDLLNQTQKYRLLHFGTLFGSGRLRLSDTLNVEFQTIVREAMVLSNLLLDRLSNQVIRQMGGKNSYYALHVRLGDGVFAENATTNVQAILRTALIELFRTPDKSLHMNFHSAIPYRSHFDGHSQLLPVHRLENARTHVERTKMCSHHLIGRYSPFLQELPLYIATDVDPRRHPALQPFFRTFPCVYFLSSFKDVIKTLKQVQTAFGTGNLSPYLMPLLDALVVGNSAGMIGTPNSTFRYMCHLYLY